MSARTVRLVALALLLAAVAFRLWAVPHARFTGDESDYWFKSRQVAAGAYRPVYGPEITGSEARLPGPAYYYLMALPQTLGRSPYFGSVFVALLHGVTALALFSLVARARGPRAGLIALALVAFAPWDVLYADRIWGSCVVPVWGCLALYAAAQSRERPAWLGGLVFLALVLPQLHLSVPVLWAACAVIVVLRPPPRWPKGAIAVGLALTVLAYLPPLIAELRSGLANTQKILAHGGGAAPWEEAVWAPAKVFGYALLYGTSEIGYHFARGYWGGGFSEATAYFTGAGLSRWWSLHGPWLAVAHVVSLLIAALGWTLGLARTIRAARSAYRARRAVDLETALTCAIVVGLAVGAALLLLARKTYFPHYANILMPVLLAPVAFGLDAATTSTGPKIRWAVFVGVMVSMIAMAVATVRYYRTVDSLNGLRATLSMVGHVLDDPHRGRVRFTHFHNAYAWQRIAEGVYDGSLAPLDPGVVHTVHNRAPHRGAVPPGGRRFGRVLLVRRPPQGPAAVPVRLDWTAARVEAEHPDGRRQTCAPAGRRCRYGPKPWQKFEPTMMTVGGRRQPLLFMHPIQGGAVRAEIPVPPETLRGTLLYALSDDATRSDNRAPVVVTVRDRDGAVLADGEAVNRPGLARLPFAATATRGPVVVEIRTDNEGARVFGFDLEWQAR